MPRCALAVFGPDEIDCRIHADIVPLPIERRIFTPYFDITAFAYARLDEMPARGFTIYFDFERGFDGRYWRTLALPRAYD